jgi:BirA family biotin operon repressor/biotin-[acetyl-CoA-carboxylase] ligase
VRHIRLSSCGSTNDEAELMLEGGQLPPFLVSTAEQTNGRGREGRSWSQPRGNFAGTFAMAAPRPLAESPGAASLAGGLAVLAALQAFGVAEQDLQIKWPNDVLLRERKVSGILAKMHTGPRREPLMLIGIGVNLAQPPREARFPAAAVFEPGGGPNETMFGDRLGVELLALFRLAEAEGTAAIMNLFRGKAWRLGQEIAVTPGGEQLTGVFENVDEHGHMLLRTPKGELRTISAGDTARR